MEKVENTEMSQLLCISNAMHLMSLTVLSLKTL